MDIRLANGTFRKPHGNLLDVHIVLGTFTYLIDFLVMEISEDDFWPIIFGRPFLNTEQAKIDCKREAISL